MGAGICTLFWIKVYRDYYLNVRLNHPRLNPFIAYGLNTKMKYTEPKLKIGVNTIVFLVMLVVNDNHILYQIKNKNNKNKIKQNALSSQHKCEVPVKDTLYAQFSKFPFSLKVPDSNLCLFLLFVYFCFSSSNYVEDRL